MQHSARAMSRHRLSSGGRDSPGVSKLIHLPITSKSRCRWKPFNSSLRRRRTPNLHKISGTSAAPLIVPILRLPGAGDKSIRLQRLSPLSCQSYPATFSGATRADLSKLLSPLEKEENAPLVASPSPCWRCRHIPWHHVLASFQIAAGCYVSARGS